MSPVESLVSHSGAFYFVFFVSFVVEILFVIMSDLAGGGFVTAGGG